MKRPIQILSLSLIGLLLTNTVFAVTSPKIINVNNYTTKTLIGVQAVCVPSASATQTVTSSTPNTTINAGATTVSLNVSQFVCPPTDSTTSAIGLWFVVQNEPSENRNVRCRYVDATSTTPKSITYSINEYKTSGIKSTIYSCTESHQ